MKRTRPARKTAKTGDKDCRPAGRPCRRSASLCIRPARLYRRPARTEKSKDGKTVFVPHHKVQFRTKTLSLLSQEKTAETLQRQKHTQDHERKHKPERQEKNPCRPEERDDRADRPVRRLLSHCTGGRQGKPLQGDGKRLHRRSGLLPALLHQPILLPQHIRLQQPRQAGEAERQRRAAAHYGQH